MDVFGLLGDLLGSTAGQFTQTAFQVAMFLLWDSALSLLRGTFTFVDWLSQFTVSTTSGPVGALWQLTLWVSSALAVGLFFWQIISTALRGGRGFIRLITGPAQYGAALAVTVGMVAAGLSAMDGLTDGILNYGLHARNFSDAFGSTSLATVATTDVKGVILGLIAVFGVLPAAIGFMLEMIFREAVVYVLVATIPIAAAGLLASITSSAFWRVVRWIVAALAIKPTLAFGLVVGVAMVGGAQGVAGTLAGALVLVIVVFFPFALYKLLAPLDPNTDAGQAIRDAMSDFGIQSYGKKSVAGRAYSWATGQRSGDDDGDGDEDQELANTDRFDRAAQGSGEPVVSLEGHSRGGDREDRARDGQSPGNGAADEAPPVESSASEHPVTSPVPAPAAEGSGNHDASQTPTDSGSAGGSRRPDPEEPPPDAGISGSAAAL